MNGKTARVASASFQSRAKRITAEPTRISVFWKRLVTPSVTSLIERLDVVREAADEHAGPVALVEAEREPLQVAEELVAQVGEDPLPCPASEIRLRAAHEPVERTRCNEDDDDLDERR
jgi:hypothetical protein